MNSLGYFRNVEYVSRLRRKRIRVKGADSPLHAQASIQYYKHACQRHTCILIYKPRYVKIPLDKYQLSFEAK